MTEPSGDRRPLVGLPRERPPVPGIPNPIVVRARAEETGGAFERIALVRNREAKQRLELVGELAVGA